MKKLGQAVSVRTFAEYMYICFKLLSCSMLRQVKFREFLSTEYGEAQLDFLLEAMKLEKLPAREQEQAAAKVIGSPTRICLSHNFDQEEHHQAGSTATIIL